LSRHASTPSFRGEVHVCTLVRKVPHPPCKVRLICKPWRNGIHPELSTSSRVKFPSFVTPPSNMANVSMTFTQTVLTSTYSPTVYSFNYPALTTQFTPPPECSGRWLAPGRRPNEVYSTAGPRGTDTRFDPKYSSCQPLSGQAVYSPGVCPDHYTIQTISELQFTSSGTFTSWWLAPCCPRYETLPSIHGHTPGDEG
jgi:hypothetical protein